jgi:hypothetical protein
VASIVKIGKLSLLFWRISDGCRFKKGEEFIFFLGCDCHAAFGTIHVGAPVKNKAPFRFEGHDKVMIPLTIATIVSILVGQWFVSHGML